MIVFGIPSWLTWAGIKPEALGPGKISSIIAMVSSIKLNIFQMALFLSFIWFLYNIIKIFKNKEIIYKNRLHFGLLWTIKIAIKKKEVSVLASEPKCKVHKRELIDVGRYGSVWVCPTEDCKTPEMQGVNLRNLKKGAAKIEKASFLEKIHSITKSKKYLDI